MAKTLSQIGLTQAEIAKLPAAIRRKVEAAFGPANTANGTWMLVGAPTEAAASVFGTAIARVALVAGAHAAARQEKNIERLLELIVEDLPRSDGDLELELENAEMRAQYLAETKLLTALVEVCEFNPDSCGAGRHRGGLGYDLSYRLLEDAYLTPAIERTVAAPWGIAGGRDGAPNGASVKYPDGSERRVAKATAMRLPSVNAMFSANDIYSLTDVRESCLPSIYFTFRRNMTDGSGSKLLKNRLIILLAHYLLHIPRVILKGIRQ